MLLSSSKKQKLEILDINLSITATESPNSKQIKAKGPQLIFACNRSFIDISAEETR